MVQSNYCIILQGVITKQYNLYNFQTHTELLNEAYWKIKRPK